MAAADALIEVYRRAYLEILKRIAERRAAGRSTAFDEALMRDVGGILSELDTTAEQWAWEVIPKVYGEGVREALAPFAAMRGGKALQIAPGMIKVHQHAVQILIDSLLDDLRDAHTFVGRRIRDQWRSAQLEAVLEKTTTGQTIRQAQKGLRQRLADEGLTAFRDSKGREWALDSYANMVVRSVTAESQNAGLLMQLDGMGHDLVRMTEHRATCPICSPYEGRVYSRTGQTEGYPRLTDVPGFDQGYETIHPNCVPAGVLVEGPSVLGATSRRYEGELVIIRTASGIELPVTPNHPILTLGGWIAAGKLMEGDQIVRYMVREGMREVVSPDYIQPPALIEDVARTLEESGTMTASHVPVAPEDFHGDGAGSEVCVIWADGLLRTCVDAALTQPSGQRLFGSTTMLSEGFLVSGAATESLKRVLRPAAGLVCGRDKGDSFLCRKPGQAHSHGLAPCRCGDNATFAQSGMHSHCSDAERLSYGFLGFARQITRNDSVDVEGQAVTPSFGANTGPEAAQTNTGLLQAFIQGGTSDAMQGRYLLACLAGAVEIDHVIHVKRRDFAGHVYNLQTASGWYACNFIITHNCRHRLTPYVPEGDDDPDKTREFSNRPFEDTRSAADKEAYERQQEMARLRRDRRKLEQQLAILPAGVERDAIREKLREVRGEQQRMGRQEKQARLRMAAENRAYYAARDSGQAVSWPGRV